MVVFFVFYLPKSLKRLLQFLQEGYGTSFCLFQGHKRGNLHIIIGKVHPSYQTYWQDLTTAICETEGSTAENNLL